MKALLSNRQCVLALIVAFIGCLFLVISCNSAYALSKGASVDWPNWHGPHHNGISSETGWQTRWPEDGPKILWKKSIGTGFSSIAVSRGRIYTMGNTGKKGDKKEKEHKDIIYCLDAHTGREIWRKSYPCPVFPKQHEGGPGATPTVDGNIVYTLSKKGDLYCLNAETGQVVWYKNLVDESGVKLPNWYFAGSPLVIGELLILNAGTAGMAL
ncbi:MAG: PQQ-binding-like beta-propeller repeat protein, partial [Sedimentisphaerales bacterium]|nr:PQQ-binding-like beta-propeller repeat protein [Sedimentisphaerales bacterium]